MNNKWIKFPLYGLGFIFAILVLIYFTFPLNTLRAPLEGMIEDMLSSGQAQGPLAMKPKVSINGDINFWRITGLSVKDIHIGFDGSDEEEDAHVEFSELKVRLAPFKSLFGPRAIEFEAMSTVGRVSGGVGVTEKGMQDFSIHVVDFDLSMLSNIEGAASGFPLLGKVTLHANVTGQDTPKKKGDFKLKISGLSVGPGPLTVPVPGMTEPIDVPKIVFGDVDVLLAFNDKETEKFEIILKGGDLELDAKLGIKIKSNVMFSPIEGEGWFKVSEAFLNENTDLKNLYEMGVDEKTYANEAGKIGFDLKGSLAFPMPKLKKIE